MRPTTRNDVLAAMRESDVSYAELERRTGIPKSCLQRYLTTARAIPEDSWSKILLSLGVPAVQGWAITLRVPKRAPRKPVNLVGVVRVSEEAELVLHQIAGETGLSLKEVASELIVQAAKICVIEEATDVPLP